MAKVTGSASLTIRIGLGHKKQFTQYDHASPFYSMSIEREVSDNFTDAELADEAERLSEICRDRVERKIQADVKDLQSGD